MGFAYNRNSVMAQPGKALEILTTKVKKSKDIKPNAFSCEIHDIGDSFINIGKKQVLNSKFAGFAEMLVGAGKENLAGIVYSFLIKVNQGKSDMIEHLATKALKIAKRQHDPVHIMARADDLRRVLDPQKDKERVIRVLFDEKRALGDICSKYESVKKRYNSIAREMKPVEQYKLKLAAIKAEIAELLIHENPNQAVVEIAEAKEIMNEFGKGSITKKLDALSRLISNKY